MKLNGKNGVKATGNGSRNGNRNGKNSSKSPLYLTQLGERILEARQKKSVTLDALSREMKISKGNLSDIERGKRDPRLGTLRAIAEGLDIPLHILLKGL